jgi:hypothetical protein
VVFRPAEDFGLFLLQPLVAYTSKEDTEEQRGLSFMYLGSNTVVTAFGY